MKKVQLSYVKLGKMLDKLTDQLRETPVSLICGVMRGGMPVAVHLSHNLGVDLVADAELLKGRLNIGRDKTVLLVDDVVDTGTTLSEILKIEPHSKIITAALYYKPHSAIKPDYFVAETTDWIVFPWELFDEKPNRERYEHL